VPSATNGHAIGGLHVLATVGAALVFGLYAPALSAQGNAAARDAGTNAQSARDQDYNALVKRAIAEYELGHWPEAKAFFLRAHQLTPNARTLRGLGLAAYELRSYVEALTYLRQALVSRERSLTAEMRAEVTSTIAEVRTFIAYHELTLEPHDVSVRVDGQPAVFDSDGKLLLDPGPHEIQLQSDGFEPLAHNLTVKGGEHGELRLTLRPQPAQLGPRASNPSHVDSSQARDTSWWSALTTQRKVGLALAAGGVVALGLGTTFGILAVNSNDDSKDGCTDDVCNAQGYADRDDALTHADMSTVSFIAGGALLGAGAIVYFTAPFRVSPVIDERTAGLTMAGSF
jgi:hypothetical protein